MANRVWVAAVDGSGAAPLTPGPLDAYPAWLDPRTILFARSSFLSDSSQVISVGLDGQEHVLSPPHQYFVEPKPLPDGRSYGATMETGTELHLVKVSRADGAALKASGISAIVLDRLAVPAADGSSFTMAWILAGPSAGAPTRSAPNAVFGLAGAGLLILLLFAAASYRNLRRTNAC